MRRSCYFLHILAALAWFDCGAEAACGVGNTLTTVGTFLIDNDCTQFTSVAFSANGVLYMSAGDLGGDFCELYEGLGGSATFDRTFTGDGVGTGAVYLTGTWVLECTLSQLRTGPEVTFEIVLTDGSCSQMYMDADLPLTGVQSFTASSIKKACFWDFPLQTPSDIYRLVFRPLPIRDGARLTVESNAQRVVITGEYHNENLQFNMRGPFKVIFITPSTANRLTLSVKPGFVESCGMDAAFDIDGKLIIDNDCLEITTKLGQDVSLLLYHSSGDMDGLECTVEESSAVDTRFSGNSGNVYHVSGGSAKDLVCTFAQVRTGDPITFKLKQQTCGGEFSAYPAVVQSPDISSFEVACFWQFYASGTDDYSVNMQPQELVDSAIVSIISVNPESEIAHWKGPTLIDVESVIIPQSGIFRIFYISDATPNRFDAVVELNVPEKICSDSGIEIPLVEEDMTRLNGESGDIFYISPDPEVNLDDLDPQCRSTFDEAFFQFDITRCPAITNAAGSDTIVITYTIWNRKVMDLSSVVQRYVRYGFNFTCQFNATKELTSVKILPELGKVGVVADPVNGEFDVTLQLFDNDGFSPVLPPDAMITVPEYLFGKVALNGLPVGEEGFVMGLQSCWTTQSNDPDGEPMYPIVTDRCAATSAGEASTTRVVLRNYQPTYATFKFQSFAWTNFTDVEQAIFVHCDVTVCHNSSAECIHPGCSRERRSVDPDHHRRLSFGPVRILQPNSCEKDNGMCSDVCQMVDGRVECSCYEGRKLTDGGRLCEDEMNREFSSVSSSLPLLLLASLIFVGGMIIYFIRKRPTTYSLL